MYLPYQLVFSEQTSFKADSLCPPATASSFNRLLAFATQLTYVDVKGDTCGMGVLFSFLEQRFCLWIKEENKLLNRDGILY